MAPDASGDRTRLRPDPAPAGTDIARAPARPFVGGPGAGRALRARALAGARGEPLHVPSHALVIHFPAALLPTSLLIDLVARLAPTADGLAPAASLILGLGLLGGLAAAATGLLDWAAMIPGPRRARVTRHLLVQAAALAAFGVSLALRAGDMAAPAPPVSLAASVVGLGLLLVGDHLGGLLVYRDGMRVRSGGR